ncbi:MAG: hypothetical protein IJ204_05740 [Paludibacteraceae bacterium]|nr:hypothetical protein [Paludibacteraceae bacterium]
MMKDSLPQDFLNRLNKYEYSFVQCIIDDHSLSELNDIDEVVKEAWVKFKDCFNQFAWNRLRFASLRTELAKTNDLRTYTEGNQLLLSLCNAVSKYLVTLLHEYLSPCYFEQNWIDPSFPSMLKTYCLSKESDDSLSRNLETMYWNETQFQDARKTLIPHLTTPFIFMLLRYTYYHTIVRKMAEDAEYGRSVGVNNSSFDFSQVKKVDWGKFSRREVCEKYAITWLGGGLHEIIDSRAFDIKNQEDVPHDWYLTLVETEGLRLRNDYTYLRKHFNRRFVASLMEWHQFYFEYLVECLHNCEEYKDYPIEKLVPQLKTVKPKQKIIDETRALTPLGLSCRRAIAAKIRECKTAADLGVLLYKFQHELKFFTLENMSRRSCYLCMQQIGDVHFDSSGDFSNCDKGYLLAQKKASIK